MGGDELAAIMKMLFDAIQSPSTERHEEGFQMLSPARFGSFRVSSAVDAKEIIRTITAEKVAETEAEQQPRELLRALNRKDVTGNAPMHLAFVMVKSSCVIFR